MAQLTIVDYGLCSVEGEAKRALVGDSPEGVLSSDQISIVEKTNMISATKGTCFGVLFTAPHLDDENLGVEARIHHPPITLKNGRVKEITQLPLFIFSDQPSFVGWRFKSSNELVSGDWVIEFSNDYKVLARQRFMVHAAAVSGTDEEAEVHTESKPYADNDWDDGLGETVPAPIAQAEMDAMGDSAPMAAPVTTPSMDRPDHPDPEAVRDMSSFDFSGQWKTVTRYFVQVAAHAKQSNMIAFENRLRGMGLSPFTFVEPVKGPRRHLYLTFVNMSDSKESAAAFARSVRETYGIDAFVYPIKAVVPAEWPLD